MVICEGNFISMEAGGMAHFRGSLRDLDYVNLRGNSFRGSSRILVHFHGSLHESERQIHFHGDSRYSLLPRKYLQFPRRSIDHLSWKY